MSYIGRKIRDVMIPRDKLVTIPPDKKVVDAVKLMWENKVGSVLIVSGEKLLGIFTERDLLRLVATGVDLNKVIEEVMTRDPYTLRPDQPLSKAALLMSEKGVRHVPITDEEGNILGIISSRDISRVYSEAAEASLRE